MVLRRLPELPEMGDPSAPSAPPETDLCDVDPEQATFRAQLKDTYQRCLQVREGGREGEREGGDGGKKHLHCHRLYTTLSRAEPSPYRTQQDMFEVI